MDDLRERLLRAEGARARPRVALPDLATLRRAALRRTLRRGAIATLLAAAAAFATLALLERRTGSTRMPGSSTSQLGVDLDVIAALESAAAMRLRLALRAADPRPDLQVILDRFPDTSSARRAARLLEPSPYRKDR